MIHRFSVSSPLSLLISPLSLSILLLIFLYSSRHNVPAENFATYSGGSFAVGEGDRRCESRESDI